MLNIFHFYLGLCFQWGQCGLSAHVGHQGHTGGVWKRQCVRFSLNHINVFVGAGGTLAHNSRPRDTSCLQYLTGLTGRIESFNFRATADNHLNNQQYLKQSLPSFDSINDQQTLLLQVLGVHKTGETKQGNLCNKTLMDVISHLHSAKQEGIKAWVISWILKRQQLNSFWNFCFYVFCLLLPFVALLATAGFSHLTEKVA